LLKTEVFELKQVLQADASRAVEDFMVLWPDILAHYEARLEAWRREHESLVRE